ncbi:putative toxin-antitoxin system, toxin component [Roseibium sp. TrichSKD4]|nr:SRPBCC domain-containing protein [Roseibium sp. TrichSKD4]EFO29277.1 putative toxin-antitoxin system, toxin component [Roseibium sp. TrichSKD4]
MSELPTYLLERAFKALRELVWRTWTDPELLVRWYGPNVETIIHELDVRPGGFWLNEMKMGSDSGYQAHGICRGRRAVEAGLPDGLRQ